MDISASSAVSSALYMNQAQTAEQAQMQLFRQALELQAQQVTEVLASANTTSQPDLATEGALGTRINTFA